MADGGAQYKDVLSRDCCEFYSKYITLNKYNGMPLHDLINDGELVAEAIDAWLIEYSYNSPTVERAEELRNCVLSATFYLILHEVKSWGLPTNIFEEAVQNACIAVIQSMDQFDPSKNVKFSTFLVQCHIIKTAIRSAIEANSIVKIPTAVRKKTARTAKNLLRVGKEPETVPFGKHIVPLEDIDGLPHEAELESNSNYVSYCDSDFLEQVDCNRFGGDITELVMDDQVFAKEIKKMCEVALCTDAAKLTENEKITLKHKHGLLNAPILRNREIVGVLRAQGHEVSEPRICQYNNNGMAKMRAFLKKYNDPMFFTTKPELEVDEVLGKDKHEYLSLIAELHNEYVQKINDILLEQ